MVIMNDRDDSEPVIPYSAVAPSLAPTRSRSLAPTRLWSLAPTCSVTCAHIRPRTGERGGGRRGVGRGRGGHDNDLVSCRQHDSHDHIQSPTRPARPVTRIATGERGEGEGGGKGGGMITTLLHAANTTTSSHDHSQHDQSPGSQRVRGGRGEGEEGGMVTTLFHAASMATARHDHIQSPMR